MMQSRTFILLLKKSKGELTDKDDQELSELLQSEHQDIIEDFEKLLAAKVRFDEQETEQSLDRVLQRIRKAEKKKPSINVTRRIYFRYAAAAVAIITVLAIGWLTYNSRQADSNSGTRVFAEKKAYKADYILPDGTRVKVNKDSRLSLFEGFNQHTREIYLDGEAFFNVVKDKDRPFIVHTNTMDVKVLGTAFNVRAFQEDSVVETALIRGSVEVMLKNQDNRVFRLKPSEKIIVKANKSVIRSGNSIAPGVEVSLSHFHVTGKDSVAFETQWTKEALSFDDEKLKDLIPRLEKWYNITIEVKEPALQNIKFSGIVKDESIKELLELFKITSGLKYKIEKKHVTIY
ncbi:FecR family protein [Niabella aquatica]